MAEKIKEPTKIKEEYKPNETYKPKKETESAFDKVLEFNRQNNKLPTNVEPVLERETYDQRVVKHKEQGEGNKEQNKDEKERERSKEKARDERKSEVGVGKKVVGKGRRESGSQTDTGTGGRKGRGFGRSILKKAKMKLKQAKSTNMAQIALESSKFAAKLKAEMARAYLSKEFIENLVNQLVKFVKTGLNKDGEKEVRLDLHERIFRGLRLHVASKGGKVSVHFETADSKVRELFSDSSGKIRERLEAKGIDISEIKVS